MTRHLVATALLTLTLLAVGATGAAEEPTRESLLTAWEQVQRDDPNTVVFEKVEPDRYRFETRLFPFDGVVSVLNTVIDDRQAHLPGGFVLGMVEAKLEELPDEFLVNHSYSISLWQSTNTLYFDIEEDRWITVSEWQEHLSRSYPDLGWLSWLSNGLWIVLLAVLVAVLWWVARKANRQMKQAMAAQDKALADQERVIRLSEEALQISRDSNSVLREILDVLRDRETS